MEVQSDPKVQEVFDKYPESIRPKMLHLRNLVLETASEMDEVQNLEETLRWGEPSYIAKKGSTLRMDWKEKTPDQYAVYFKCTSQLVPTFKTIYSNQFKFEGTRAIVFKLDEKVPEKELKHCISLALNYHRVKHLPLLGA